VIGCAQDDGWAAQFGVLRAETDATLELIVALRSQLAEIQSSSAAARRLIGPHQAMATDRRILAALKRQEEDPTLAHYPEPAVRLAARLANSGLNLTLPEEEELRRPGAAWRLFRQHVSEAGPSQVFVAWAGALASVALQYLRPGPKISADFDEITYLLAHPDAAAMVAAGKFRSGYEHWIRLGQRESRAVHFRQRTPNRNPKARVQPRPGVPADFDEDAYLFFNQDVANGVDQGLFPSGYDHWLEIGRAEGRGGGIWQAPPERSASSLELMGSRPYGVNFHGFLSAASGLGSAARGYGRVLQHTGIPVNLIDVPDWRDGDAKRRAPDVSPYRINLLQQNPDVLPRFMRTYGADLFEGCYNIGYWVWELPAARSNWRDLFGYFDEIWTPSEFCRQAFQQLTPQPVVCVPHVVEGLEEKALYSREHFQLPAAVFLFGCVFDVSSYLDRKNPWCAIEAFKREFGDSPQVLLCLKFSNNRDDESNARALREAIGGASNIRVFDQVMDETEIASFHNAIDCLVSPHRSEGFGLNLAEAMYLGKPVIATRYSGNLDYMRDDNSYLIDYTLTPIPQDIGPYQRGAVWADPSTTHLGRLMRAVFDDPAGRLEKGRRAARDIRAGHSAEAVGRLIARRFHEIGLCDRQLQPQFSQPRRMARPPAFFHSNTPAAVAKEIRTWKSKPVISVVTPVYNTGGKYLRRCIDSVRKQYYPWWELCLCDDGSTNQETLEVLEHYRGVDARIKVVRLERNQGIATASNRAAEISTGSYLAFLDHDDELAPEALFEAASAIQRNPEIDLLYTDEDKLDENGELTDHYCKPDWSPEHLLSVNYVLHMLVVRKELFYAIGQFRSEFSGAQDYDLVLRLSTRAQSIHHVPKILYHWRKIPESAAAEVDAKPEALDAGRRALEDHVRSHLPGASVERGLLPGLFRVRRTIQDNPLASLCILASGRAAAVEGRGSIDLVSNLVQSIAAKTDYGNYEIVVVDDGNLSDATRAALSGIPHRRVRFPEPNRPFNFSRKANFAWKQAQGRYIVLLNDDLEVIARDWLGSMIELLQCEDIGVVGAKLLFPDGRIQHAGLVLGVNGGAAHVYHAFPDLVGYNAFTHVVRNYSAVTAACMATRREVLEATSGFDERLPIDYNDVDFCLKAIERGYRVVYTPHAELLHFEGASIPRTTQNPREVALFRERWAAYVHCDPHYNPNLMRHSVDFSIDPEVANWPGSG
jgi:GT2 family glycosyltransferase/glycosyltransferase involved in cell wall biosynthesis